VALRGRCADAGSVFGLAGERTAGGRPLRFFSAGAVSSRSGTGGRAFLVLTLAIAVVFDAVGFAFGGRPRLFFVGGAFSSELGVSEILSAASLVSWAGFAFGGRPLFRFAVGAASSFSALVLFLLLLILEGPFWGRFSSESEGDLSAAACAFVVGFTSGGRERLRFRFVVSVASTVGGAVLS